MDQKQNSNKSLQRFKAMASETCFILLMSVAQVRSSRSLPSGADRCLQVLKWSQPSREGGQPPILVAVDSSFLTQAPEQREDSPTMTTGINERDFNEVRGPEGTFHEDLKRAGSKVKTRGRRIKAHCCCMCVSPRNSPTCSGTFSSVRIHS